MTMANRPPSSIVPAPVSMISTEYASRFGDAAVTLPSIQHRPVIRQEARSFEHERGIKREEGVDELEEIDIDRTEVDQLADFEMEV